VQPFILTVHIILSLLLIIIILMQPGKGADISSAFGGGGGTQLFGASGPGNFLTRGTGTVAFLFMVTSITLALLGGGSVGNSAGSAVQTVDEEKEGAGFGNSPAKPDEASPAVPAAPITPEAPAPAVAPAPAAPAPAAPTAPAAPAP